MITPKPIEPKPFVHSIENHRRALRAVVDKLTNNKFRKFYEDHIDIDVVSFFVDGERGYYVDLDYDGEPNHVIIIAKIDQELVDEYRDLYDEFEDVDETGRYCYDPIELVDDPTIMFSSPMKILANELIKNNFDPNGFRTCIHYPFSLKIEPEEFTVNIRVSVRKDRYQFLANGDGRSS